jgi:hypothetical protein
MKNKALILTSLILMAIIPTIQAQINPYEAINENLVTPVEVKVLWPFESDQIIPGMSNLEMKISYKLSFEENTALVIDFNNFEHMQSAVYLKEQISGKMLMEKLNTTTAGNFESVFEQINGEEIFYMVSNNSAKKEEVYFLATTPTKYELMYFKYKPAVQEKDRLQFQLKETPTN